VTTRRRSWSFYSKATTDIEFTFPFGWGELWGIADRTDYDLAVIRRFPARISPTSTRKNENTFRMSSSRRWAATVWFWPSCARLMTRRLDAEKNDVRTSCISIRRWHRSRSRPAAVQEAGGAQAEKIYDQAGRSTTATTMTAAPSESAIAVRMRSVRLTASPMTSIPRTTSAVTIRDRDTMEQVQSKDRRA
jgi:hypothetical protein